MFLAGLSGRDAAGAGQINSMHLASDVLVPRGLLDELMDCGIVHEWLAFSSNFLSLHDATRTFHELGVEGIIVFLSYVKMHFSYVKSSILRNCSNILCKSYVLMFTLENSLLRRSIEPRPAGQRPTTLSGQPPHLVSHPTLPPIPPNQQSHLPRPANQPSLPARPPKPPCQLMRHSHVGVAYVERDQGLLCRLCVNM